MTRYSDAFDAGMSYGRNYRKTYRSWSYDANVARRAADTARGDSDYTGFYHGVIQGLQPFSSERFAKTFEENAQLATYKASAKLGKMLLRVETHDEAHYLATLAYWESIGAVLQPVGEKIASI